MGWDISYHPLGEHEVGSVYFAGVENPDLAERFAEEFGVSDRQREQLSDTFRRAREIPDDTPFAKGHAYNLAILAGFLRKYWYVRGSALSFVYNDMELQQYFGDWKQLVPERYTHLSFDNLLTENYSGGVFLSHSALRALKADYAASPSIYEKLNDLFSAGRLNVFWEAVDYALARGLGLMEAAEVVEPNPCNLNDSSCYSNLHNCDLRGALLYRKAALALHAARAGRAESKKAAFFE